MARKNRILVIERAAYALCALVILSCIGYYVFVGSKSAKEPAIPQYTKEQITSWQADTVYVATKRSKTRADSTKTKKKPKEERRKKTSAKSNKQNEAKLRNVLDETGD